MANRITSLCIDAADPARLADFWCAVLDWQILERADYGITIGPEPGARAAIDFLRVPDGPKLAKNRLHLDINPTDRDQAAELERLLEIGARQVDIGQGEPTWFVLSDPEGNEFCLLRSQVE